MNIILQRRGRSTITTTHGIRCYEALYVCVSASNPLSTIQVRSLQSKNFFSPVVYRYTCVFFVCTCITYRYEYFYLCYSLTEKMCIRQEQQKEKEGIVIPHCELLLCVRFIAAGWVCLFGH
jgi:hypothetical protein